MYLPASLFLHPELYKILPSVQVCGLIAVLFVEDTGNNMEGEHTPLRGLRSKAVSASHRMNVTMIAHF